MQLHNILSSDFSRLGLVVAYLVCLMPLTSALDLVQHNVPYYVGPSASSAAPFPAAFASESSQVPVSSSAAYTAQSTGHPYVYGTAASSGWVPRNNTGAFPTGGMTHNATTSRHGRMTVVITQSPPVPHHPTPAPESSTTGGAAPRGASLAGCILAGCLAFLAV